MHPGKIQRHDQHREKTELPSIEELTLMSPEKIHNLILKQHHHQLDLEKQNEKQRHIIERMKDLHDSYTELNILLSAISESNEHGKVIRSMAVLEDITERKRAEAPTKEAHQRFLAVLNSINAIVYVSDMESYDILFINKYGRQILGDIEGKKCWSAIKLEKKGPCRFCTNKKLIDAEGNPTQIYRWEFKNKKTGKWYDCQDRSIEWIDNRIVRLEIAIDITDRKKVEEELRDSKRFFETVFDSIQDGISVLDTQFNILSVNRKMEKWYSHMLPLKGKKCYEAYHKSAKPCENCPVSRSLRTGKLEMVEHPLKQEDIDVGTVELYAFPMLDDTGETIGVVEYIRNITERKRAEAATQQAHQRLITVLDSIDASVYVADMETYELLFVNRYTKNVYGNVTGKLCWQSLQKGQTGPCGFCTNDKLLDADGKSTGVYHSEFKHPKTGRWYECRDSALRWIDGRMVRMEIALDITERKKAEELIKISLREKETLLKEIHHRVKNNMQVISSLLNLQILRNKDEHVKKALMDCQGRINSMASVHEMLYKSSSLSLIDCQEYITKLSDNILRSYNFRGLQRIKLTVETNGVTLGIQQASPLGLIINEMLSNALKYGFPGNRPSQIIIRLKADEHDFIKFVFTDNGVGIPNDLDWQHTKSLGMNLIVRLAENQLGGNIRLEREKGTCFTIEFNRKNNQSAESF